jgi:cysteine-rich repeat protein
MKGAIMRKILYVFLSFVVLSSAAIPIDSIYADDWPMFHHDLALSGYSTDPAPDSNNILWTYPTGAPVQSSPAVVGNKVYVGSLDYNMYCLDKYDGSLIWSFATPSMIESSPAVENGRVFFLGTDGIVYCLDAEDGSLIWSTTIGPGPWDWSSPAVSAGAVFVGSSTGVMYSLDAGTGAINWTTTVGGSPDSPISVVNGKVYTGTHNFDNSSPTLVALDETTGTIIWTYDYYLYHSNITGMVNSNGASVADGDNDGDLEVYFGVFNWEGVDNQAICLDEATGNEVWTANINGNSTSTPAVHDGKVFIGSDDGSLYALDAGDGSYLWSYATGGEVWSAPAVSGDGKVCFGSLDHTVYCVSEETGSMIWSYFTGASRLISSPAISDGMLIVGNENGQVYAFAGFCGDGMCEGMETCETCPEDCGECPPECGDGVCNGDETCETCPEDCGECPPECGDGVCEGDETCETCPEDCGECPPECGDGVCEGDETCGTCPEDCGECPTDQCVYSQGYWKNHNRFGKNPPLQIPWPIDEGTMLCDQTWLDILKTPPKKGNAFYILGHQWIAAELNVANGADTTPEIDDALVEAEALLIECEISDDDRQEALALASLLDDYNNGLIGPPKCDFCGDGTVQEDNGEQCDDGNNDNADGCSCICKSQIASCGQIAEPGRPPLTFLFYLLPLAVIFLHKKMRG